MQKPTVPTDPLRPARMAALPLAILLALAAAPVVAQDEAPSVTPPGLPTGVDWTFNFDATMGAFSFANSYYANPKPEEPSGDLSDNWMEASLKPAISGVFTTKGSAQFYGTLSGVGERTYGAGPSVVGEDASSFQLDELSFGWRSGEKNARDESLFDFTVGRAQYQLGHGMLLWDGAAEGGTRGGYWTNARKAFEGAAIGRFQPGNHKFEAFFLDKDDLPEADSSTKLWGVNYEYLIGEDTTLGATYLKLSANDTAPQRDGLSVYDFRVFTAPFDSMKGLSFEAEYAIEDNGNALDSTAYNVLAAYQLDNDRWKPKFSYRYAIFEGDDPTTAANENFDGLLTGFYDWGTWWQGEIAGEYFVSNSNLISHQLRVHTTPNDSIGMGLILFDFTLDHPASLGVTSDDVGTELDWYMDWSVNDNVTLSFVAAYADPGAAIQQLSGRNDEFFYGMVFAAYSF